MLGQQHQEKSSRNEMKIFNLLGNFKNFIIILVINYELPNISPWYQFLNEGNFNFNRLIN